MGGKTDKLINTKSKHGKLMWKDFPAIPRTVDTPSYCCVSSYKVEKQTKNNNNKKCLYLVFFLSLNFNYLFLIIYPLLFPYIGKCVAFYKACWVKYTMLKCVQCCMFCSPSALVALKEKKCVVIFVNQTFNKKMQSACI